MANWIEWCPLTGLHLYMYIVFKALNLNGADIMGVTLKLLNPEDVTKVLGVGGGRESGERVSAAVRAFGEMVKQNDSGGLLFERLPVCQFRCNVFIDSLLSAT